MGYSPWGCKESDTTASESAGARTHTIWMPKGKFQFSSKDCLPQEERAFSKAE